MNKRALISRVGTVLLVVSLTALSWSKDFATTSSSIKKKTSVDAIASSEERFLNGALLYLKEIDARMPEAAAHLAQTQDELYQSLFGIPKDFLLKDPTEYNLDVPSNIDKPSYILSRTVISTLMAGEAEILFFDELLKSIPEFQTSHKPQADLIKRYLACFSAFAFEHKLGSSCSAVTEEQSAELIESLGWTGGIAAEILKQKPDQQLASFNKVVESEKAYFKSLTVIFVSIFAVLFFGSIFALILIYKKARGKLPSRLVQVPEFGDYGLEIFGLYLLSMGFVSLISDFAHKQGADLLVMNLILIPAMLLLVLWPNKRIVSFTRTRAALGLSFKSFFSNVLLTPVVYCSGMLVLLVTLLAYSGLLQYLEVDVSKAAHPIVPVLINSDGSKFWMIFCLAVVVAPIVEEVMFRGALYSWLRARAGVFVSVLSSSIIFAVVHPQGLLGVLPLTMIGAVLACAREWRGSLVTPMLVHACINCGTLLIVLGVLGG